MKALRSALILPALFCFAINTMAQADSTYCSRHALLYADSLANAFRDQNWNRYLSITYPGIISYYGGTRSFQSYIQRTRSVSNSFAIRDCVTLDLIQISANHLGEWQCVIRKTGSTVIDGKKAMVISYLIGQSTDDGDSWKFLDVSYNATEKLNDIMPERFPALMVPERKIIFEKGELASAE